MEHHVGSEALGDKVTVVLEPGTQLLYDISVLDDEREFGCFVLHFFRVQSGQYAGECVRALDVDTPWGSESRDVTPARLGLRPVDSKQRDRQ